MSQSPPASGALLRERLQRALGETYQISRELGGGGSAHVFLATEVALGRPVVLKVLPSTLTDGVDGARFVREMLIAARLQHPHLVPLLSAAGIEREGGDAPGEFSGLRWYTMPFVEGETLREHLHRRAPLPLHEAFRLLREMASALAYAHAKGVVHRDIKPENILLSDGVAMISDFGVAKALDDASAEAVSSGKRITTVSMTLGTPAYMAPEQINSAKVVDHKADLYALGCVAYELLTGAPPFVRSSLRATMAAQLSEAARPLRELRPDVPAPVADALMRCLEKDPLQRPHSASVLVKVLDGQTASPPAIPAVPDVAISAPAAAVSAPVGLSTRRTVSLATAVVVVAAILWWWLR